MSNQENIKALNKDFTGYIRIYQYRDPHMGYGDCGTVKFFKVEKSFFEEKSIFPYYRLKTEIVKLLKIDLISNGWEFTEKEIIQKTYDDNLKAIESLKKANKSLNILLSK